MIRKPSWRSSVRCAVCRSEPLSRSSRPIEPCGPPPQRAWRAPLRGALAYAVVGSMARAFEDRG